MVAVEVLVVVYLVVVEGVVAFERPVM